MIDTRPQQNSTGNNTHICLVGKYIHILWARGFELPSLPYPVRKKLNSYSLHRTTDLKKENKNSVWFPPNTAIYILFYYDNMFRPTDHHQAIPTKPRTRYNAVQIISL
jgi:hypothetical protein